LTKKHENTTTLYCNVGDNKLSSFVFIPSSKDFGRLKINENNLKWFEHVLTALGGSGNENETLVDLLTHIGRKDDYGDAWKEAVKLNGHSLVPRLDTVASFAVQSACNINQTQMKQLRCCLHAEIGSTVFSTEVKITQVLGLWSMLILTLDSTTKFRGATSRHPKSFGSALQLSSRVPSFAVIALT
jgi:hypothetical protein